MSQNMLIQHAKGQADFISCLNQGNLWFELSFQKTNILYTDTCIY